MDIKKLHELWPDYLLGKVSDDDRNEIESFLKDFPEVKEELSDWDPIMEGLNSEWTTPSSEMDKVFYENLNASVAMETTVPTKESKVFKLRPWMTGIAASIMLVLGFLLGKGSLTDQVKPEETWVTTNEKLKAAEEETNEVRTQLVISLADQPSASKRLEALSEVRKLDNATDKVIEALFKMLNNDPNVNVRLAAVTSLSKYVENPIVREGLVMSITQQESPLVQIALAELMVTLKEQKSINSMETLLKKPDINEAVKEKLEESIKEII